MVAGIVIRVADQKDGVSWLVGAKNGERLMECVPQSRVFAHGGGYLNHPLDDRSARSQVGQQLFREKRLAAKIPNATGWPSGAWRAWSVTVLTTSVNFSFLAEPSVSSRISSPLWKSRLALCTGRVLPSIFT